MDTCKALAHISHIRVSKLEYKNFNDRLIHVLYHSVHYSLLLLQRFGIVVLFPELSYKCHQCKFNVRPILGSDFKEQEVVSIGKAPSIFIGYHSTSEEVTRVAQHHHRSIRRTILSNLFYQ